MLFSHSAMSDSATPSSSPSPGSHVLHYLLEFAEIHRGWCYLTISSSATPFSFCLQSFPASGSFQRDYQLVNGAIGSELRFRYLKYGIYFPGRKIIWFSIKPTTVGIESQLSTETCLEEEPKGFLSSWVVRERIWACSIGDFSFFLVGFPLCGQGWEKEDHEFSFGKMVLSCLWWTDRCKWSMQISI